MNPSLTPTRKIAGSGLAASISIILVWAFSLAGVDVPGEVGAAFTAVATVITGYFVKDAS